MHDAIASHRHETEVDVYMAVLAARAVQADSEGNTRLATNCGLELARIVAARSPGASPLLVTLARRVAARIVAAGGEWSEEAAAILAEADGHLVLGTAASVVAEMASGECDTLARGLERAGYMAPYWDNPGQKEAQHA